MYTKTENSQPFNDKKIVGIIAVLVLLGLVLILMTNLTSTVLSGARAFVDGEGILSKAQKRASLSLVYYLQEEEAKYYEDFNESVAVIESYRLSHEEITKKNPDLGKLEKISRDVAQDRANSEDIRNTVWMYQNLYWTSLMKRADAIWVQTENLLDDLIELGREVHQQIVNGELSTEDKQFFLEQIYSFDNKLTQVESNFSKTVARSTIYVNSLIYWSTLVIGLILLAAGGFVSIRFMRNAKRWGDSVSASEQKFRNVVENTQDVIYRFDREEGRYVYMSPSVEEMLGFSASEILESDSEFIFDRIHPEDLKRLEKEVEEVHNEREMDNYSDETEFRIKTKSGEYIWVSNKRSVIFNEDGKATDIVGNVRDISDRKEYQKRIDQSLEEKKILLQEIHHRVKNNLAVISGLLYLQKEELEGAAKSALDKTQSRIESVAMIHEKLYGSDSLSDINLAEYIDELTETITNAYESDEKKITMEKDLEPVHIEIVDAVTFGLAINELVNNAYKHAFESQEGGIVKIELKENGEKRVLRIADNGKGLPKDFSLETTSSLGMMLIQSLSEQLGAQIDISSNSWTEFKITF